MMSSPPVSQGSMFHHLPLDTNRLPSQNLHFSLPVNTHTPRQVELSATPPQLGTDSDSHAVLSRVLFLTAEVVGSDTLTPHRTQAHAGHLSPRPATAQAVSRSGDTQE